MVATPKFLYAYIYFIFLRRLVTILVVTTFMYLPLDTPIDCACPKEHATLHNLLESPKIVYSLIDRAWDVTFRSDIMNFNKIK